MKQIVYIGQAKDFERRRAQHIREASGGSNQKKIHRHMANVGIKNFSFKIEATVPGIIANRTENALIREHDTVNNGFNAINAPNEDKVSKGEQVYIYSITKNIDSERNARVRKPHQNCSQAMRKWRIKMRDRAKAVSVEKSSNEDYGSKCWHLNDELHRVDGSAIENAKRRIIEVGEKTKKVEEESANNSVEKYENELKNNTRYTLFVFGIFFVFLIVIQL